MKKAYLLLVYLLILILPSCFGQITFTPNGYVGINTRTPNSQLDVNGNIQISNAAIPMGLFTELAGTTTPLLNLDINNRAPNANYSDQGVAFRMDLRGGANHLFQWLYRAPNNYFGTTLMALMPNGNLGLGVGTSLPQARLHVVGNQFLDGRLGIGTNNFSQDANAKLIVDGIILAEDIITKNVSADHVFNAGYKLRSLTEVEKYINQNKHLPDVPAASETEKGVRLAEFNTLLLQKIEELTLYIIDLDKKIALIQKENEVLKTTLKK
eukprot:TRINITY_DN6091_c0_g1_i1.p2 TRINITY_DN6091_c0_g1~~TRINITY_DN6091_c0_g1_i1.p2  ORF type:complete len:268 (-),score=-34.71 TRINITY_DN6091_c0_g1_i1:2155-2958(-)